MEYLKRERILSLCVLAGAVLVRFLVIPMYVEVTEEYELAGQSPAFFPKLAVWLIAALAVFYFASLSRKKSQQHPKAVKEWLSRSEERKVYICALVVVGYYFAIKVAGFLIPTSIMLFVIFLIQGVKRPLKIVIISISVTAGVYLFFFYIMQVQFPEGLIFE